MIKKVRRSKFYNWVNFQSQYLALVKFGFGFMLPGSIRPMLNHAVDFIRHRKCLLELFHTVMEQVSKTQVGEGIDQTRIGERVWIWNGQWNRPFGTAAQYVVLPSEQAVVLPNNVDFAVGATLGVPALTAWRAVTMEGDVAGKTLFVAGGAGAVGHFAIQIAKAKGSTVITTVSSDEKAAHAHQAGADYILNYRTQSVVERVKEITNGKGVDLVIDVDIAANGPILPDIIAQHGTIMVYGTSALDVNLPILRFIVDSVSIRFFVVYELQSAVRQAAISDLTDLLQAGAVTAAIGKHFPLTAIVDAPERS